VIGAGGQRWEGHTVRLDLVAAPEGGQVGGSQQLGRWFIYAVPRPNGMNYVTNWSRQPEGGSDHRIAGHTWSERPERSEQLRPSSTVNRAIYATAAGQRLVRGGHQNLDRDSRDVASHHLDVHADSFPSTAISRGPPLPPRRPAEFTETVPECHLTRSDARCVTRERSITGLAIQRAV
jgi:hypothetical protein